MAGIHDAPAGDAREAVLRALRDGEPLAGGYLFWSITERCLNRCGFCGQQELFADRGRPVDRRLFARVIRAAAAGGLAELVLTGGEPGLHPDLEFFVQAGRESGMTVSVATSGAGGAGTAARLKAARPDRVAVSIDCAEANIHDGMRGRPGALRDALHVLRTLSDEGHSDLCIVTVITRDNIDRLQGLIPLAGRHRVLHLALSLVMDPWGLSRAALRPDRSSIERYLLDTLPQLLELSRGRVTLRPLPVPVEASRLLQQQDTDGLARYLRSPANREAISGEASLWAEGLYNAVFRERFGCPLPLRDVMIAPDGDVYPCSSPTALLPENRLGNIHTADLTDIRRNGKARQLVEQVDRRDCCAACQSLSNSSDGTYLVLRQPGSAPDTVWRKLRVAR